MVEWEDCYGKSWGKLIVPDAYVHPAKFSYNLIQRIYEHMLEMNWIQEGSWVFDPFGGVGLGAYWALQNGLYWIGVELEGKFVESGRQNIELWESKLRISDRATLIQGDSRYVAQEGGFDTVVSSPPYAEGIGHVAGKNADKESHPERYKEQEKYTTAFKSEGNLGSMKDGDFDAIVSSPPFIDQEPSHIQGESPSDKRIKAGAAKGRSFVNSTYGKMEGNIGNMKEGDFDAIVSSPPYEGSAESGSRHGDSGIIGRDKRAGKKVVNFRYNESNRSENIGGFKGSTFWSASRMIVENCYHILKPGGHAVWVTKDFVRNKKRVPFSEQWTKLCESAGFEFVCGHRAMLIKREVREGLFETDERVTERKSFFRRLAEKKGSPRIDWENVICMKRK